MTSQQPKPTLDGRPVGSFGAFAMFSLYPTKNMTSGEGGMVACATDEIARNVRLLRNQGMERQYANEVVGFNARMTDVHAAIGRVQLTKVEGWTADRQRNAAFLSENLEGVVTPPVADGAVHVYHQYTIRVAEDRDGVVTALREEHGVGSGVYYPIPNHRLESLTRYAAEVTSDLRRPNVSHAHTPKFWQSAPISGGRVASIPIWTAVPWRNIPKVER